MRLVTLWYKITSDNEVIFNHLDFGHNTGAPAPISAIQTKKWTGIVWQYKHAYMDSNDIVLQYTWFGFFKSYSSNKEIVLKEMKLAYDQSK